MKTYLAYQPDRTIRDVYEPGSEQWNYDDLALSPYARVGTLADKSKHHKLPGKNKVRVNLNYHRFTFVAPFAGRTLSPNETRLTIYF